MRPSHRALTLLFSAVTLCGCAVDAPKLTESAFVVASLYGDRPIVPRLGGFPHADCPPDEQPIRMGRCGRVPSPGEARFDRLLALGRANARAADRANPHATGVWHLVWAEREEHVERAVAHLQHAVQSPGSTVARSDLAAAFLYRASVRDDPFDIVAALAFSDRALAEDGGNPAALFNRALALGELGLKDRSRAAWGRFLELASDESPAWAQEARARLAVLEQATEESASATAANGTEGLAEATLARWADAWLTGREEEASAALAELEASAIAAHQHGDRFLLEVLGVIERAEVAGDEVIHELARGHRRLAYGLQDYREMRIREAEVSLSRASDELHRCGSPFAWVAELFSAIVRYYRGDYGKASEDLERLLSSFDHDAYPGLAARAHWMQGLIAVKAGRPGGAIATYELALAHARPIDGRLADSIEVLLAEALADLGDRRGAWRHRRSVLRSEYGPTDARTLHNLYYDITRSLRATAFAEVSAYFHDEAVRNCPRLPEPACAESLLFRARFHLERGAPEIAERDLGLSLRHLDRMPRNEVRQRVEGEVKLSLASSLAWRAPSAAISVLEEAERLLRRHGRADDLLELVVERARLRLGQGSWEESELELSAAATELERLQETEFVEDRVHRFRRIYELMAHIQLTHRRNESAAFDWIGRASVAEWEVLARGSRPLQHEERMEASFGDATVLRYGKILNELYLWLIAEGRVEMLKLPVDLDRVDAELALFEQAARAGDVDLQKQVLRSMHTMLMPGNLPISRTGERLVIVPDASLYRVPWAILIDREQRYLLETVTPIIAPAARWASTAGTRTDAEGKAVRLVSVADPAFDGRSYPALRPLSSAREEVELVSTFYENSVVLAGSEATPERALRLLADADVFHFAGHAVVDGGTQRDAGLVLSPSDDHPTGLLSVREILKGPPLDLRLVVLASCHLGGDATNRFPPMVMALLLRGVPTVIAATGELDDAVARQLFIHLHRELRAGTPPAEALREAQLALRHHDPAAWGRVRVFGPS